MAANDNTNALNSTKSLLTSQPVLIILLGLLLLQGGISSTAQGQELRGVELNEFVGEVVLHLGGDDLPWVDATHLTFTTPHSVLRYRLSLQLLGIPQLDNRDTLLINDKRIASIPELKSYLLLGNEFEGALNLSTSGGNGNGGSQLSLFITLLRLDPPPRGSKTWFDCDMDEDEDEDESSGRVNGRWILSSLKCNGRSNCPRGEDEDEGEDCGRRGCGGGDNDDNDGDRSWYEVQYLLTILLAGLFFILSPICIVIFLFYHRRMSAARRQHTHQHTHHQRHHASNAGGEVWVTSSPPNDVPPSYEDVHELKTPPPPFQHANATPQTSTQQNNP